MTHIYKAVISVYEDYEGRGSNQFRQFGTDVRELEKRIAAAQAQIAPESAWTSEADGSSYTKIGNLTYYADIDRHDLVC